MDFKIKLYRWPADEGGVILIGRGQVEPGTDTTCIPEADERLYTALNAHFGSLPAGVGDKSLLPARARKIITEVIKNGKPELQRVAAVLGMGPRTLQRRLKAYGVDFKGLANSIRCELAIYYLKDRNNRLTDIALLLGYSEVSAFNRAFKRWTGSTPLQYRRMLGDSGSRTSVSSTGLKPI
jgi:AraC-like DNA-binding protein